LHVEETYPVIEKQPAKIQDKYKKGRQDNGKVLIDSTCWPELVVIK
jgi:hypothetical protein